MPNESMRTDPDTLLRKLRDRPRVDRLWSNKGQRFSASRLSRQPDFIAAVHRLVLRFLSGLCRPVALLSPLRAFG